MNPLEMLLRTGVLPGAVALFLIAFGTGAWRRDRAPIREAWVVPLAIGLAYALGHAAGAGVGSFPPHDVTHWPFYFAVVGALLGIVRRAWDPAPSAVRWIAGVIVCVLLSRVLLDARIVHAWGDVEGGAWLGVVSLAWVVLWASLEMSPGRLDDRIMLGVVTATALVTSICVGLVASIVLARINGTFTAVAGALFVAALWNPAFSLSRSSATPLALTLGSLWIITPFYSELSLRIITLIYFAALTPWLGRLPQLREASGRLRAGVQVGSAGAALIVALALAVRAFQAAGGSGY